jgi:hypothetical protein
VGLAAAAVVVLAVAAGALVMSPGRLSVATDPSASASPTGDARPSAQPTATPTPTPSSPAVQVDAHLVGPFGRCADGIAGFVVTLPDSVYAERADGERPACRTFGGASDFAGAVEPPRIIARVSQELPSFEQGTVVAEERRTSDSGVPMTRYEVRMPETGALAASHSVYYLIELAGGSVLVAQTDAGASAWVERLDMLALSISLTEPIAISADAAAEADELFAVRDICEDPERGMVVTFPEDWWTNTAVDDLPACSWFSPAFFEFESSATVPDAIEITVQVIEGDYAVSEPPAWETLTLLGRPGMRWLVESDGERRYEYVVQLGEAPESGPNLVARTVASGNDQELAMAVLDRLVRRISFASAPPGASSTNPPITAPPVAAEATEGDFRLELVVQQERYRAGQPIIADMTLTYLGDEPSLSLWGSGLGVLGSRLRQIDGSIEHGWATTTDCRPHPIAPGEPMHSPFVKSGGHSADEPNADFYEAYFRDPLLRLPPGRWEITAVTGFTAGGDDCGDGPPGGLQVSVEITVEP